MTPRAAASVPQTKPHDARLEARISADLHTTVKRAAEIQGRTVTDFVVHALQIAASQAIEEAYQIQLSLADQQAFAQALIAPPKPNAALKRAFAKSKKLLAA
ncbi:MAG: DUF1778 domain-containing protein [Oxalobacteraceae bacterium]|nr:DUF1778 domain-containing protein [Oxalobacteraceae bacterium]